MKRTIIIILICIVMSVSVTVYAEQHSFNYRGYPIVNIKVDNYLIKSDVPALNMEGTTLVPLRFVAEKLGSDVKWDDLSKTAIITSKSQTPSSKTHNELSLVRMNIEAMSNKLALLIQQIQIAKDLYINSATTYDINTIEKIDLPKMQMQYKLINNQVLDFQQNNKYDTDTSLMNLTNSQIEQIEKAVKSFNDALSQLVRYTERPDKQDSLVAYYSYLSQANRHLIHLNELINDTIQMEH